MLVLLGGIDSYGTLLDDVWEYTSTGWGPSPSSFSPESRLTRLVYDPVRHAVVMSGGLITTGEIPNDTWLFDGNRWNPRGAAGFSPNRWGYGATFDSTRQRIVLFGGFVATAQSDTWLWDGQTWMKSDASGPSARTHAALADVARDQTVVLFGGSSANAILRDTWEFDGVTWTERATPDDLVAPEQPAMAYDPNTERAYLVDGVGVTWAFRDHAWKRVDTQGSPPARSGVATAYDPWRRRIIRFGGAEAGVALGGLWELVGTTWQEVPLYGASPPARPVPALAPLPEVRGLVLFGGVGSGDTWILRFSSLTPDEDCMNGIDDDGDRRVDTADPDCAL
jgi:hypothetical protein